MRSTFFYKIKEYNADFDEAKLKEALDFVVTMYEGTDANIQHPLSVLELLMPLKPDDDSVLAVLLHDLYINSLIDDDFVRNKFGSNVVNLLIGLKNLSSLDYEENDKKSQIEALRKMFLVMASDVRGILIWLACRLANLQHLSSSVDADSNVLRKLAKETMDVYVPIASRLGMYRIKTELEDLSFKYLQPLEYEEIKSQVDLYEEKKKSVIENICLAVEKYLKFKGCEVLVSGRLKSVYSIYAKLKRKGLLSVDQLNDLFAIRVIVSGDDRGKEATIVEKLYMVLGLIHSEWRPVSSKFKDYIAVPKPNGYKSLHTVVIGLAPKDSDQLVEIQIRDAQMHKEAEYGIASHWLYKDMRGSDNEVLNTQVEWIKGLERVEDFVGEGFEVMKEVEMDIFKDRIFALTPRGEVKDLPAGSIPLDFAYSVHTDVGHRCVMAKVNGHLVPLDYCLKNGDVVEILTKKDATPKLRWLSMAKSNFAKNKIRSWFSSLNKENNIKEGKIIFNKHLERLQKPLLDQKFSIFKNYLGGNLSFAEREGIIEEIGKGGKLASDVVRKIYPYESNLSAKDVVSRAEPDLRLNDEEKKMLLEEQVVVGGESGLPIKISACCAPDIKDKIVGYVTKDKRISVHKIDCNLLDRMEVSRIINADWKGMIDRRPSNYRVGINLTVFSRVGLIHDITSVIADYNINIVDVVIKKAQSKFYHQCFLLDMNDLDKFDDLLDRLEEVKGVLKIVRDDSFK